jgi:hypothetical protein
MLKGMHYKPEPLGVCPEGLHWATIAQITPIGNKQTRYGLKKDEVRFDFRVTVDGVEYKITHEYPLTVHPESNFHKLLVAVRIPPDSIRDGIDLNDLIGKAFNGKVYQTVKGNIAHANIIPLPPPANACHCGKACLEGKDYCNGGNCAWSIEQTKLESEPEWITCAEGDCTNAIDLTVPAQKETGRCYRHCGVLNERTERTLAEVSW